MNLEMSKVYYRCSNEIHQLCISDENKSFQASTSRCLITLRDHIELAASKNIFRKHFRAHLLKVAYS